MGVILTELIKKKKKWPNISDPMTRIASMYQEMMVTNLIDQILTFP